MLVRLSTLMCARVCVGGGCSQGHNFYKLKHRSFKQLLLFLFTKGFKLILQEVSLKLFRTMSNLHQFTLKGLICWIKGSDWNKSNQYIGTPLHLKLKQKLSFLSDRKKYFYHNVYTIQFSPDFLKSPLEIIQHANRYTLFFRCTANWASTCDISTLRICVT